MENSEIEGFAPEALNEWLKGPQGWVLFTPSDLLRSYLQQALPQEGLAATEDRVPVWSVTRNRIARDVLRVVGPRCYFSITEGLVNDPTSSLLSSWALGFRDHFFRRIHQEIERLLIERSESLETVLGELKQVEDSRVAPIQRALLGAWHKLRALGRSADHSFLPQTIRSALQIKRQLRTILEQHKTEEWPESERQNLVALEKGILESVNQITDVADESVDSVLRKIPFVYHEYRLRAADGAGLYRTDKMALVNDRRIDPIELDMPLYVALLIIRGTFGDETATRRRSDSITDRLRSEFRYFVAVDEATDFSAVELACMRLLAHPAFDSATFSGDLMQRMTGQGILEWSEVSKLVAAPERHELRFSYRQTKKLLKIAARLFERAIGRPAPFEAGFAESPADPDVLHCQCSSQASTAEWLVGRIGEVYELCGQSLPSIAILVPDEGYVNPVADLIRQPLLEAYGIDTEACLDGRILGTQSKVRVFSVRFIKGLEFEAVFFVAVDKMVAHSPDLLDRFLYVGLTRARSFLGLTTQSGMPMELTHVTDCFIHDSWKHLLPTPTGEFS